MKLNEIDNIQLMKIWNWIRNNATHFGAKIEVINDTITYDGSDFQVELRKGETKLPFKFGDCNGNFIFTGSGIPLESLENCPTSVGKNDFHCSAAPHLKSLKGVPFCNALYTENTGIEDIREVFPHLNSNLGFMNITGTKIKDWRGAHELCKVNIRKLHIELYEDTIGGIGLLLIPGLVDLELYNWQSPIARKASAIIRKYEGHPDLIYDCQAELIDEGLEQFAQL